MPILQALILHLLLILSLLLIPSFHLVGLHGYCELQLFFFLYLSTFYSIKNMILQNDVLAILLSYLFEVLPETCDERAGFRLFELFLLCD